MSTIDRQAILEALSRLVTPGIKLTALADELGARKPQYASLREILLDLVEDGTLQVLPGGAFALAPSGRPGDPGGKPVPPARPEPAKISKKPARAAKQTRTPRTPWGPAAAPSPVAAPSRPGRSTRPPAKPALQPREIYDPETGEVRSV